MSDVDILFDSLGFDKLRSDFDNLHHYFENLSAKAQQVANGLSGLGEKLSGVGEKAGIAGTALGGVVGVVGNGIGLVANFAMEVAKISVALTGVAAAAGGAAIFGIAEFTKKVIQETESESKLEIALLGVMKSTENVGKAHQFAVGYATQYGIELERILGIVKTFALMPQVGVGIKRGDVDEMKRYMDLVSQLQALKPDTSVEAVANAIKMASMGRSMALRRITGISVAQLAAEGGFGEKEMTQSPAKMVESLEAYTKARGGQQLLAQSSELVSRQMTALSEAWKHFLDEIGNAGVYDLVISKFKALRSAVIEFLGTEQFRTFAEKISMFLEDFVNTLTNIFTKGIDWSKVTDWESLKSAIEQVANNAVDAFLKVWDKIKEPLTKILIEVFKVVAKAVLFTIKEVFLPIGVGIGDSIVEGYHSAIKKLPIIGGISQGVLAAIPGGAAVNMLLGMREKTIEAKKEASALKTGGEAGEEEPASVWAKAQRVLNRTGSMFAAAINQIEESVKHWSMTSDNLLKWTEAWAGMSKRLAEGKTWLERIEDEQEKDKAHRVMREKWDTGELSDDKWKEYIKKRGQEEDKKRRVKDYEEEYEKRLTDILGMSGVSSQTQSGIYQKLFGISMEKGRPEEARDYMNKSLDAMVHAQAEATKLEEQQLGNLEEIAANTRTMAGGYAKKEGPKVGEGEKSTATPTMTARDMPLADDVFWDVKTGIGGNVSW